MGLGSSLYLGQVWKTFILQAIRDSRVRAAQFASAPQQGEKVQWRHEARMFLENCLLEDSDNADKQKLPKKQIGRAHV